jgi:hypothetical protein
MRLWSNTLSLTLKNLADRCRSQFQSVRAHTKLAGVTAAAFLLSLARRNKGPRILVGTHHKVLTVFMMQVFRDFARITDRRISVGMGDEVDYSGKCQGTCRISHAVPACG